LTSENNVSTIDTTDFSDFSTTNPFSTTRANGQPGLNVEGASHTRCGVPTLSGLIHLLPKFYGLAGEDLHKHLKEFHVVCSTMRLQGILEDYIKMKAFSFSLDGAAKDWLYLQPHTFLEKFSLTSHTAAIQKEICGIQQVGKTLHEYWERFNRLCVTCPHHQISEQLLIQYFYEGLMLMDRSMIDATSARALMDKTPAAARHLISNMASNTQQFEIKGAITNKANQLTELTSLVRQLAVSQHQQISQMRICGICTSMEHFIDMCPHITGNRSRLRYPALLFQQPQQQILKQNNSPSMEELMKFQQNMNTTMHDLKIQLQSVSSGNLPSQPISNLKGGNVSTVTLRSGKELQVTPQSKLNPTDSESEPEADSRVQQQAKTNPLPFPS
ncbi:hypothetical protein CR513_32701, partial [Mucuna pruriens]